MNIFSDKHLELIRTKIVIQGVVKKYDFYIESIERLSDLLKDETDVISESWRTIGKTKKTISMYIKFARKEKRYMVKIVHELENKNFDKLIFNSIVQQGNLLKIKELLSVIDKMNIKEGEILKRKEIDKYLAF